MFSWRTSCHTRTSRQTSPTYQLSWTFSPSLSTQQMEASYIADGSGGHPWTGNTCIRSWRATPHGHVNGWTASKDGPDSTALHTRHHQCSRTRASSLPDHTGPRRGRAPSPHPNQRPWHGGRQTTDDSHRGSTRPSIWSHRSKGPPAWHQHPCVNR